MSTVERLVILANTILKINQKMGWGSVFPIVVDQNPSTELNLEKQSTKNLTNQATRFVYIDSYLIADYDLTESIKMQLWEGVDVRIGDAVYPR